MGLSTPPALKQPTWCTLPPEKFALVASRVASPYPENILFTLRGVLPEEGEEPRGARDGEPVTSSEAADGSQEDAQTALSTRGDGGAALHLGAGSASQEERAGGSRQVGASARSGGAGELPERPVQVLPGSRGDVQQLSAADQAFREHERVDVQTLISRARRRM